MQISKATQAESTSNRLDWPNRVSNLVASIRGAFICINFHWDGSNAHCAKKRQCSQILRCIGSATPRQTFHKSCRVGSRLVVPVELCKKHPSPKQATPTCCLAPGISAGQQLWRASLEWWYLESAKTISPKTSHQDCTGHCGHMLMPILKLDCKEKLLLQNSDNT